ncbi:carbonate dehydratase [Coraliomargarita sinensis]|uniref:Carbonic anhydrase n=1 Tax=Coraliomargarita sinensis TaxID=2174842 RepID=A0A317ZGN3_9BACT|nr:carbonate dehydratase [Coraliomargarita sinensis]PXA04765.1 carbonate dehydratase [Coraliomargarita sinensis]
MPTLSKLLERNRIWADDAAEKAPDFFTKLAKQQTPDYLWIGCSDSRIPANQIMGLAPGEVFVHRNIANMVVHTDMNLLSVLQYAIDLLKVKHVIVTGHYGCGGVKAAMRKEQYGLLDNWLQHIQDVESVHLDELAPLDEDARFDRMCELNVIRQADNLRRNPIIQNAWKRGQHLEIHTWIYCLTDGRLQPLQDVITGN